MGHFNSNEPKVGILKNSTYDILEQRQLTKVLWKKCRLYVNIIMGDQKIYGCSERLQSLH